MTIVGWGVGLIPVRVQLRSLERLNTARQPRWKATPWLGQAANWLNASAEEMLQERMSLVPLLQRKVPPRYTFMPPGYT